MKWLEIQTSIVSITVTFGYVRLFANRTGSMLKMILAYMLAMVSGEYEILQTIIIANMVLVMDFFLWLKVSTQVFLHNQAMLANVAPSIRERMAGVFDEYIAPQYHSATLPTGMLIKRVHPIEAASAQTRPTLGEIFTARRTFHNWIVPHWTEAL